MHVFTVNCLLFVTITAFLVKCETTKMHKDEEKETSNSLSGLNDKDMREKDETDRSKESNGDFWKRLTSPDLMKAILGLGEGNYLYKYNQDHDHISNIVNDDKEVKDAKSEDMHREKDEINQGAKKSLNDKLQWEHPAWPRPGKDMSGWIRVGDVKDEEWPRPGKDFTRAIEESLYEHNQKRQHTGGLWVSDEERQNGGLWGPNKKRQSTEDTTGGLWTKEQGGGLWADNNRQGGGLWAKRQNGGLWLADTSNQNGGLWGADAIQQNGLWAKRQNGGLWGPNRKRQNGGLWGPNRKRQNGGLWKKQSSGGLWDAKKENLANKEIIKSMERKDNSEKRTAKKTDMNSRQRRNIQQLNNDSGKTYQLPTGWLNQPWNRKAVVGVHVFNNE